MKKLSLLLAMVMVTSLVFTVSCVSKEVPVTETYYETQYGEGVTDLTPQVEWHANLYGDSTTMDAAVKECRSFTPLISYYGYEMSTDLRSASHVKVLYSYTGFERLFSNSYLYVHDLTGIGQIVLPTNFEFGSPKPEKYQKTRSWKGAMVHRELDDYNYIPTPQEQEWLENYHSIVGTSDLQWACPPEKARCLLASFSFWSNTQDMCYVDPGYTPHSGGLTDLGVAVLGLVYKYNCSITFDTSKVKEFAIVTRTMPASNIFCTAPPDYAFSTSMEISSVQLIRQVPYQVEKQRVVMQTKKVPFWEAIFGE